MRRKFAILIDGGFLKKKLGSTKQAPISAQTVADFTEKIKSHPEVSELTLHRVYYYDAEPFSGIRSKPLTNKEQPINFSLNDLYKHNMELLQKLKEQPFFAVRLGEVSFRGWIVNPQILKNTEKQIDKIEIKADDIIPNIQQKGVDMKVGLDMSSLALKNHVDVIVMITGDSDFIPAMKFARQEGKQIYLFTLGQKIRPEVRAHTDLCIEENAESLPSSQSC